MPNKVTLRWYSGDLVIDNPTPEIEYQLHYEHKSLVRSAKGWGDKDIKRERVPLFRVMRESGPRTIVTYQGLIDLVAKVCEDSLHYYPAIQDCRESIPGPDISKMRGFRCKQFSLTLEMLRHNRSGIMKAPTRYGKTVSFINVLRAYPTLQTVVAAPGVDLLGQLVDELRAALPGREIRGIFTGSKGSKCVSTDITVCSLDSLDKMDFENTRLVIVDEPHAIASPSRLVAMGNFKRARVYGFGATTDGRFDNADHIITGLVGPVLAQRTFKEAVAEGAICPIKVFVLRIPFANFQPASRDNAYGWLIHDNHEMASLVAQIEQQQIPQDWQTIVFVDEVKQAVVMNLLIAHGVSAIASKMSKAERQAMFEAMKEGRIKRCMATRIYSTGVTFPDLRCVINACGGGGSITGTQKPGRLAQIRPGKKCGYLIDFLLYCPEVDEDYGENPGYDANRPKWGLVTRDCWSRIRTYQELGYEVQFVDKVQDITLI